MSPVLSRRLKSLLLGAAAIALAFPATAGSGQEVDSGRADAPGMPRNILPAEQPPDAARPPQREDVPPPALIPARGASVQVGDLGTIEGPVAGTLDNSNGGLGYGAWQGSDRAIIATMLQGVPAATPSAAQRLLMRKLLLTAAPAPPGRATLSFNQLRLNKLLEGGYLDDAAALAVRIQEPMNFNVLRTQTDALLYAGRDTDACSDITAHRLDSAESFWVELRAFCYAVTGDAAALDLTRAVIMDQGIADPAFLTLLDGMASAKPMAPETIRFPDSLHIMMLARLKLPMTAEIATNLGLPASLTAAASPATPRALRMAAAEKALRAGMLPIPVLAEILDLASFTPQDLGGAPALARAEPMMNALARLRAALKIASTVDARAEIVHTAFEIGEREGLLAQAAALFADDAAQIIPASDWGAWSEVMIRGLLLASKAEAAQRWFDILDRDAPGMRDTVDQLELALAIAAPNPRRNDEANRLLSDLALTVNPPPPPPEIIATPQPGPDPMSPDQIAPPQPPPPVLPPAPIKLPESLRARATLDLGLLDALGELKSSDAQAAVKPLMSEPSPGRRPPPVLMQRIDKAALSDSRGEVALSVATALGPQGAGDLAPDILVRLVRALQTAGVHDAAHALAMEALLLRPRAGAPAPR
jgi:hypothetical protein